VNGKPFLWKKQGKSRYLMIDIYSPHPDRCYVVLAFDTDPYETDDLRGKVIGRGCAEGPSDWNRAYERAREIADRYMSRN
jgi:hypothetical protein